MVDIHSHIVWGLDDGARTNEMSLAMLQMAADSGTTDIVGTPHANDQYPFEPAILAERQAALQAQIGDRIRIHTGSDFHMQFDNIQKALRDPARFSINGLGWLLVEFSDAMILPNTEDIFSQLQNRGLGIIVTHPERNSLLRKDCKRLRRWVDNGIFLQITGGSLLGVFGAEAKESSQELLSANLAHFIASDAHDLNFRSTRLDIVKKLIAGRYGESYAHALLELNPRAVIEGRAIPYGPLSVPKRRRWLFPPR